MSLQEHTRNDKVQLLGWLDEKEKRRARDDLLTYVRRTMPSYRVAPFHREVAEALMAVEKGEIRRLMIVAPPRHGKTQLVSKRFPIWYLGRNPTREIIHASYGGSLAEDAGRELRNLTYSDAHRDVFPEMILATDSKAVNKWHTTQGGVYIAAGVGGPITGRGFNLGIVDDAVKGHEEAESELMREKIWDWWRSDFFSRRMIPNSIVLINTRWHDEDLTGRLIRSMDDGSGEQWKMLHYPAISEDGEALCPHLMPIEELEVTRRASGPRIWQSLYQGNPTPEEGTYFLAEWFWEYDKRPENLRIYGASDYAVTQDGGDYTVHVVIGVDPNGIVYILDLWRKQTTSDVWADALIDLMERWEPIIWAEESGQIEKGVGPFLTKRMLERKVHCARRQWTSAVDKAVRARSFQARMAMGGGMVRLPRGAAWYPELKSEMLKFPLGKNDDQVDALSLIGRMLAGLAHAAVPKPPHETRALGVVVNPGQVGDGGYKPMTFSDLLRENKRNKRRRH